jgi:predicted dehydrogenase
MRAAAEGRMLRVAIVGCGKIADSHAIQIRRIPGCELIAACDEEKLMADQFGERFGVTDCFDSLEELLTRSRPDVVHITTPPQSHFLLCMTCLAAGCHVLIEKPFTLCLDEARQILDTADGLRLKVSVGHDDQFSHVARRMRRLVADGYLGGPPVHMESSYCYDLTEPSYAAAFLGDESHWVRRLPGGLFQNIASHGLARIAEFFTDEDPFVSAYGFASPRMKALGAPDIVDEVRVVVTGSSGCTAYFTFSSQMRPLLHTFNLYGPTNGLLLNEDHQTLLKCKGRNHKSYAEKFIPPVNASWQHLQNLAFNLGRFAANDFHMKSGMKSLFESFYRSIVLGEPLPISRREVLLNSYLMDAICSQVFGNAAIEQTSKRDPASVDSPPPHGLLQRS